MVRKPARVVAGGSRIGSVPREKLKRRLLTHEVADRIREMILVGELGPETGFTQRELADMIGVSTMPVREALLELTHDGLVDATPNRGFRVVRTTHEDVRDIYWMHATLAGELAARASSRAAGALIDELRRLHECSRDAVASGSAEAAEAANWEFHRAINLAAGAPKLLLLLKTTLGFIPHGFYALIPEWGRVSEEGHAEIVAAFARRDPEAARESAAQHTHNAANLLIQHFSETGYWTVPPPV